MADREQHGHDSIVHHAFPATALDVRAALKTLEGTLRAHGLAAGSRADVALAVGEVLNNIVEHAYRDRDDGQIDMTLEVLKDRVTVCVQDDGHGMPGGRLPDGWTPGLIADIDSLPEGGYGWTIFRALATGISYSRRDGRNSLSFDVPVQRLV